MNFIDNLENFLQIVSPLYVVIYFGIRIFNNWNKENNWQNIAIATIIMLLINILFNIRQII